MSADFDKLREIFLAALEQAPEQRDAYLDRICAGDEELRRSVAVMLKAQAVGEGPLDRAAVRDEHTGAYEQVSEFPGTLIGPYKLLEPIGEGGMGTVWLAQQTEPVKRTVALKLIKAGMDTRQVIARFEAERQALALMDHPNIARVLDAGTTDAGRPYFVMDLVKGVPITRYCDEHRLTPRQRLELLVPVCQAVQHAHQKGIIHRDLKPSNVLVALYDGKPVPKVIDFGVAKAAGQPLTDKTLVTGFGNIVGTLEYMSPEQAEVNQLDIDTRSDIYSLGVLLYELLTGSPPFTRKGLEKAGMMEMLRVIREQEPSKPSTKLSTAEGLPTLAANRGTEPAKLTKLVRGELDWIVMKALEKDRNRRYETANAFAIDVQRYLADEPVLACPPSGWYRFRKFVRRNKPRLAVAALVLFFLVLLAGGTLWQVQERRAETDKHNALNEERVRTRLAQARQIRAELHQMLDDATGLNRLLNDPAFWQARIEAALGEWKEAKLLQAAGPIDSALQVQIEELAADLQQEQQHHEMALALEKARGEHSILVEGKLHYSGALKKYRHACAQAGLDVDKGTPDVLAQAIGRSPLRRQFLAALDDFAFVAFREKDTRLHARLLNTGRLVDPDPLRDRLRDPKLWQDRAAAEKLAHEFLDDRQRMANMSAQSLVLQGLLLPSGSLQERWFRQAHRLHPDDFWLAFALGNALQHAKKHAEAAGYFSAALALRPRNTAAWSNLGGSLHDSKDLPAAIDAYQKALDIDKQCAPAWNNLGLALADSKDLPAAIHAYQKALLIDNQFAKAWNNLGNALRDSKDLPAAIDAYKKALAIDEQLALAWSNLGNALRDSKDLPGAIDAYKKALTIDEQLALAWSNLGDALRDSKDLPAAIDACKNALAIDKQFAPAWCNLGLALRDSKDLPAAIDAFKNALAIDKQFAKGWNSLGVAFHESKDLPAAIDAYQNALAIDKQLALAWNNLGLAFADSKDVPAAIDAFKNALAIDKQFAAAWNNLGNALRDSKDLPTAIDAFKNALAIDKQFAAAWNNLGNALRDSKDLPTAIDAFKNALAIDKQLAPVWNNLGNALRDSKDLPAAIDAFKNALAIDKQFAFAHANLGLAYRDLGRFAESLEALRQAARLMPKHSGILRDLQGAEQALVWQELSKHRPLTEKTIKGALSAKEPEQVHELKLNAGKTYVIDMTSPQFDTYVSLEDAKKKVLAENDDIDGQNLNSRIIVTPKENGTYRLIATSFEQRGVGAYTLTIREFAETEH